MDNVKGLFFNVGGTIFDRDDRGVDAAVIFLTRPDTTLAGGSAENW
ncbi:MAG: hypothetical protein V2I40_09280 [Desulfobacteraceae bacterium]|jgi:hypothetical protein|nr:hypothetical protein [Desulfobacteraceae bacterium]